MIIMRKNWDGFVYSKLQPFDRSAPCDIVGDVSSEELRAAAYDDAKRGLNLQSIVRKSGKPYSPLAQIHYDNCL